MGCKWLIIGITAIFAALAVVFALITPKSYEGKLRLSALDPSQIAAFAPINDAPGIVKLIFEGETQVGKEGIILSNQLFDMVNEEISRGDVFINAHQSLDPTIKNFEGSDEEKREALLNVASGYELTFEKGRTNRGFLSFETTDKDLSSRILRHAIAELNERARVKNIRAITDTKSSISASLQYEIEQTQDAIDNAVADYKVRTKAYLANLKEQAAIARQLGIADNQSSFQSGNGGGIGINVNNDLPLYLRGYKALEKEVELIEARGKNVFPYIEQYPELAAKLRELKIDKRLLRINTAMAMTPLADTKSFKAANMDAENILYQTKTSRALIVILATLLGGIIATITILIRYFMNQRRAAV